MMPCIDTVKSLSWRKDRRDFECMGCVDFGFDAAKIGSLSTLNPGSSSKTLAHSCRSLNLFTDI